MAVIYVKAKPGRRAFFEGKQISGDDYVPVADTPYVRRLINHWGDVEQKDGKTKEPTATAAPDQGKTAESGGDLR
jgi:hypothetical protein